MSRKTEFNSEQTVNVVMQTFWEKGLSTTLSDIELDTGLNRSSLYNTFGNKEDLFQQAMLCYVDFLEDWIRKNFNNYAFKDFLKAILHDAGNDNFEGKGCLFYNCLIVAGKTSPKIKETMNISYSRIRNIFENRILSAKKNNEIKTKISTTAYATIIMATIAGIRSFNLSGIAKEDLQHATDLAYVQLSQLI